MESATIVLFGATGDLAKRKIYPALYNLFLDGKLTFPFSLIGLGRREWSDELFQSNVEKSLRQFSRREPEDSGALARFLSAFRYNVLDIGREDDYKQLLVKVEQREEELGLAQNRLFYLSVGPEYFEPIALNILHSGLGTVSGWKRLVIEKPFGHDLDSARQLNDTLSKTFTEQEIFRIDHYLGKPMVQRLESLAQVNPLFEHFWQNRTIANVQITANESVGVEERAGYYDHVGAVRDMFQNHMLQLLMMAAVYLRSDHGNERTSYSKKQAMEALEPIRKSTISAHLIRGQYAEGDIQGKPVAAYRSEPGIAAESMNDTFIAARLRINDDVWRGVPFYIRTGKRLKEKATRIVVEFHENGASDFSNLLVFEIGPKERITLYLANKEPEHSGYGAFEPIPMEQNADSSEAPEAYENLIGDALRGDPTFFAHWDEVELSWQWVMPILETFQDQSIPLHTYAAGSYGPAEADALLALDGFHWWNDPLDTQVDEQNNSNKPNEGEPYAYHTKH
ncbi:MAG: glucose-6-phosphate 1-dehydrogenase [Paenibacillus sp.]|nr:glucose-6-phosphate 1-dehydrogenase [Paenibacillus sp.]